MDFKECIAADVENVFLNGMEFAEEHTLNGEKLNMLIDDDILNDIAAYDNIKINSAIGLTRGQKVIYVSAADFKRPKSGSILQLDGNIYTVVSASTETGMQRIIIKRADGI